MATGALTRGLLAGVSVANTINANARAKRQDERQAKLDARADQEYDELKGFREATRQAQKDYYSDAGEFAAPTDAVDNSMDRGEPAPPRAGLVVPPGVQPQAGVQMPQQPIGVQPQAPAPGKLPFEEKEKKYYAKLVQIANESLPPEKAIPYVQGLMGMQKEGFLQRRTETFQALANGDVKGLEAAKDLFKSQIPAGTTIDTSKAVFDPDPDPAKGGWKGILAVDANGNSRPIELTQEKLAMAYLQADPAQRMAMAIAQKKEKREEKVADSQLQTEDARRGLIAAQTTDIAEERKQRRRGLDLQAEGVSLRRRELDLMEQQKAGDETAADVLRRQRLFAEEFVPKIKDDPNSMTREEDQAKLERGQQLAGLATSIYSLTAESAKPKERAAISAGAAQFIRDFASNRLDAGKFVDNGDGTHTYGGKLVVPSYIAPPKPQPKPGVQVGGATGAY